MVVCISGLDLCCVYNSVAFFLYITHLRLKFVLVLFCLSVCVFVCCFVCFVVWVFAALLGGVVYLVCCFSGVCCCRF